ncbi:post-PEP-CTERM-1 domain-containing protein [Massilia sp. DD77]|uniref:post-PEP-CTERM-1 domain-containing protein n=1 Tax=Massilia sp. DD77 TaxID=3109349 RepID=UPI002FFFE9AD
MSLNVQFRRGLLGAGLALLGFSSQALAQQDQTAPAADNITVVRDAETGKLRDATPAERAALQASNARRTLRAAPQPVLQKYHASGAQGARLTDEFMSSSMAVRKADGKLEMQCLESHGQEAKAVPHSHAADLDTE